MKPALAIITALTLSACTGTCGPTGCTTSQGPALAPAPGGLGQMPRPWWPVTIMPTVKTAGATE